MYQGFEPYCGLAVHIKN